MADALSVKGVAGNLVVDSQSEVVLRCSALRFSDHSGFSPLLVPCDQRRLQGNADQDENSRELTKRFSHECCTSTGTAGGGIQTGSQLAGSCGQNQLSKVLEAQLILNGEKLLCDGVPGRLRRKHSPTAFLTSCAGGLRCPTNWQDATDGWSPGQSQAHVRAARRHCPSASRSGQNQIYQKTHRFQSLSRQGNRRRRAKRPGRAPDIVEAKTKAEPTGEEGARFTGGTAGSPCGLCTHAPRCFHSAVAGANRDEITRTGGTTVKIGLENKSTTAAASTAGAKAPYQARLQAGAHTRKLRPLPPQTRKQKQCASASGLRRTG